MKNGTKFTRTFAFFGDETLLVLKVQTRTTLEQKMMHIREWAIPYNNTWPKNMTKNRMSKLDGTYSFKFETKINSLSNIKSQI